MDSRPASSPFLIWAIFFLLVFFPVFPLSGSLKGGPGGPCSDCHSTGGKLSDDHPMLRQGKTGNCLHCHGAEGKAPDFARIIHYKHYKTKDSEKPSPGFAGGCLSCHRIQNGKLRLRGSCSGLPGGREEADKGRGLEGERISREEAEKLSGYFRSWAGSDFLDHLHADMGLGCEACHGTPVPGESPSEKFCVKCHGSYQEQAEKTGELDPNPHDSHLGSLRCTLCHKAHQESEPYCIQCHEYEFSMPGQHSE